MLIVPADFWEQMEILFPKIAQLKRTVSGGTKTVMGA